jgi:hypothetical protein
MSGSRPATLWRKVKDFFLQRADSSAVNAFMELGEVRPRALALYLRNGLFSPSLFVLCECARAIRNAEQPLKQSQMEEYIQMVILQAYH